MNAKLERVREFLHAERGPYPKGQDPRPKQRRRSREFERGYDAGLRFALSLLPTEDADLSMFDLGSVRAALVLKLEKPHG